MFFFTTRQYAFSLKTSIETASRQLNKLKKIKSIVSVTRGLWVQIHHPHYSPYGAVPFLLGKEQGYVSFLTALHRHNIISYHKFHQQFKSPQRGTVESLNLKLKKREKPNKTRFTGSH